MKTSAVSLLPIAIGTGGAKNRNLPLPPPTPAAIFRRHWNNYWDAARRKKRRIALRGRWIYDVLQIFWFSYAPLTGVYFHANLFYFYRFLGDLPLIGCHVLMPPPPTELKIDWLIGDQIGRRSGSLCWKEIQPTNKKERPNGLSLIWPLILYLELWSSLWLQYVVHLQILQS